MKLRDEVTAEVGISAADNYLEIMQSDKPYITHIYDSPFELHVRAEKLLRALDKAESKEEKDECLKELLGTFSPSIAMTMGFRCDYGVNIHFHGLAIVNYNVVMLDTSPIHIGDGVFLAPGVCLACPSHSLHNEERPLGIGTSAPITLEKNVWLGANVVVRGGVTIGEGSVIGAGSVVLQDIPAGVVAAGNPCQVIRKITEQDRLEMKR